MFVRTRQAMVGLGKRVLMRRRGYVTAAPDVRAIRITAGAGGEGAEGAEGGDLARLLIRTALDDGHVTAHGFTWTALRSASTARGLSAMAASAVARGPVALAEQFVVEATARLSADAALAAELAQLQHQHQHQHQHRGMTARVRTVVARRLAYVQPLAHVWPGALALMAQPAHAPAAVANLAALADEMWHVAGDRDARADAACAWYSKRGLLAAVYAATELFMTTDKSPAFVDSLAFLDRRLQDLASAARASNDLSAAAVFGFKSAKGLLASRGLLK
ncbi:Ubiquinone biosynthesis protein coq9, mitochondrial [Physocladia obscura]|uniref:Ubiquinone biosynthesis protein n=1 Tax=Physocladia obscura TaxID=109957 RepID=A0AAD5TCK3_9FUNG|nr:Ubiquinone biosynthesis protein coq9, mitochondrial [Physocladia obscura]